MSFTTLQVSRRAQLKTLSRYGRAKHFRWQSTNASGSSQNTSPMMSHMLAGVAGGGVAFLAGYSYYHFSGVKAMVQSVKDVKESFIQAKNKMVEKTPDSNAMLKYLRSTAKAYVGVIPGASGYVDSTFDSLDKLAESHGKDFDEIVQGTYHEFINIAQEGRADQKTAARLLNLLKERSSQMIELSQRASSGIIGPILESHPEVKEKLGSTYEKLRQAASQAGPEARQIMDDALKQVKEAFDRGINEKSIKGAQESLQKAADRVSESTQTKAKEAWESSKKQAQPYLDKFPQIKTALDDKAGALMSQGGNAKEIWNKIKKLGEEKSPSKETVKEVEDFINDKAESSKKGAGDMWSTIEKFTEDTPGSEQLKDFVMVLKEDSEDAKQLAEETFSDVMSVLKDKAGKAKKIAEKSKDNTKEAASSKK